MGLIPLGQIVRDKLIEEGRSTLHKYEQNLALGVRAARQLNIDVNSTTKTVFLEPTSYNTIIVPPDYYKYVKIGVCHGGMIYNLGYNGDLCFPHMKNDCGQLQPESFSPYYGGFDGYISSALYTGFGLWYNNYYNEFGEFTGRLFGYGQGHSCFGEFKYDDANREFVVTPNLQGKKICLEYTTLGVNNSSILVPEEATEYCVTFINWKSNKGGERAQHEAEHHLAEQKLRIAMNGFTMDEFISAVRGSYMMAPKG